MKRLGRKAAAHGTRAKYDQGCKCQDCKKAYAKYKKDYIDRLAQWAKNNAHEIPHGTTHAYTNMRCRCDECRAANAAYHKSHYHKKIAEQKKEIPSTPHKVKKVGGLF